MGSNSSTSTASNSVAITGGSIASGSSISGSSYSCTTLTKVPTLLYHVASSLPPNQYRLNIYHRSATADGNCNSVSKFSAGHFFLSLEGNGSEAFVGRYTSNPIFPVPEIIHSLEEALSVKCMQELEVQDNKKYLDKKTIKIDKEKYDKALLFIENKEPELYDVFTNNCIDFVQQVYNGTGLPLYFTSVYRKCQLDNLKGLAAWHAHSKFKCIDEFVNEFKKMSAHTKRHLVDALNVDEGCIIQHHDDERTFFVDIDEPLQKILKQQDQPSEIEKVIEECRIDNMLNLAEINLQEKRNTTFSRIEQILLGKIEHFNWDDYGKFKQKRLEQIEMMKEFTETLKTSAKTEIENEYEKLTEDYRGASVETEIKNDFKKRKEIRQRMNQKCEDKIKEINNLCRSSSDKVEKELKKEVGKKLNQLLKKEFEVLYKQKLQTYKSTVHTRIKDQLSDYEMHKLLSFYRLKLKKAMDGFLTDLIQKVEELPLGYFDGLITKAIESIPRTFYSMFTTSLLQLTPCFVHNSTFQIACRLK